MPAGCRDAIRLVSCAALLVPASAMADPRGIGESPPLLTPELIEARRAKLSEDMAAWLPRLVGRFKVDGIADFNSDIREANDGGVITEENDEGSATVTDFGKPFDPLKLKPASGNADCVSIGKGPGLHCVFHVTWVPEWTPLGSAVDGGEPFLAPAMKLFGLDSHTPLIMQLQLDTDGVAELESASLKGNMVSWIYETRCESDTTPTVLCRRVTRFYAPAGSNRVQLVINFEKWILRRGRQSGDVPPTPYWTPVSSIALDMVRESEDRQPGPAGSSWIQAP